MIHQTYSCKQKLKTWASHLLNNYQIGPSKLYYPQKTIVIFVQHMKRLLKWLKSLILKSILSILWYFTATLIRTTTDLIAFLGIWRISHNACISFWIPKRQVISTDTSFEIKMMVKIYAIEIIFRSHEPFQSYTYAHLWFPPPCFMK